MLLAAALALALDFATFAAERPPAPHPEPAYRYAEDVWAELAPWVADRPGVVTPEVIGTSLAGRPLWAFHVADPGTPPTRSVLVFANIHALEWVPTEVAVEALVEAIQAPPRGVRLTVIPILNPDGRAKVEADLRAGENVYRRGNHAGVDLNRDFAVNREATAVWKAVIPRRYATSPAPLSQPESRALDALAARERYDQAVSLHAFGGFIYYPWAGRWERPEHWRTLHALGETMQAAMGAGAYKPRQLARWGFFFRGHGMELDHLYGSYGACTWLVETTRSGLSPLRPGEWKNHFRWYNPRDPDRHAGKGVAMLRALWGAVAAGAPGCRDAAASPSVDSFVTDP